MCQEMIESYIDALRASLGRIRVPIEEKALRVAYDAKNYECMLAIIRDSLCLDLNVNIGLVNKGGPDVPAWIAIPTPVPLMGTLAFRATTVTIFLRRSFLHQASFEGTVLAIAHEFSHVILEALHHPLKRCEEAVDLTAMLMGFRDFFVTGQQSVVITPNGCRGVQELGYLTREEISHAADYMTFQ